MYINSGGTWRKVLSAFVNSGGTWRKIKEGFVNSSGIWRKFFSSDTTIAQRVIITQSTNATTYLTTLTGTNYHWEPSPSSLSYKFEWSTNNVSYTSISTGTATNPSTGASNTYSYELQSTAPNLYVSPNTLNYYKFTITATLDGNSVTSTSDTTVIQGPTNITVTVGTPTTNAVPLSWTSSTGANRYMVYYSSDNIFYTLYTGTLSNSTTVNGLSANTFYYFKVIPITGLTNNTGYSGNPAYATATTSMTKLDTPTLSSATQTSGGFYFTITNYSSSNGYNLSTTAGSVSRSGSTVTVSGLSSGQSATVTVVATRSGYSNSDAATITASSTSALIPVISSFTATLGNLSGNLQYVDLNWVATNQASWSITGFNGSFSGTTETGKANYVLTATSYTVTLTITSPTGNSTPAYVSFTTASPAPTIITYPVASISGNTLSVTTGTWNYNPTSYQYQWYLYNDGTGQWSAISGQNGANFNISSYIGTYTQAYAQVRAYNGNNSNWESSNTVTFSPPYTPTGVSATGLSSTSIRISWSPALYAASYEIYFAFTNSYPIYQSPNFSGITGTSFDHTGLASSTVVYYYWVRATNSYGTSAYSSPAASSTVLLNFPVNTVAPTISGSQIGSTISASTGSWTNNPTSYAYSWQVFTLGDWYQFQTAQSFTLQSSYNVPGAGTTSMSGKSIKVTVAATNAAGTGYADSSAVTVGSAPSYYAAPAYYATPVYYAAPPAYYAAPVYYAAPPAYYAAPVYYAAPPAYYAAPVYTAFLCSSQDVIDGYCSYINQCSGSANTGGSCTCSPSNIPC